MFLRHEIRFGALTFVADDSAWLQEAPLDVEALPIRGAPHFRASSCGVLLRQSTTSVSFALPAVRHRKRSGRSRLQHWVSHAAACQASSPQVAAIEPAESLHDAFDSASDQFAVPFECESCDTAAEVFMAGSHQSPPGFGCGGREAGEPSNAQQRRDEDILNERTRQRLPVSSRHQRQLFLSGSQNNGQVVRTPVLNVAAASRIADSIQPSGSEAGKGLGQIRALLQAAQHQNSAVSRSHNRLHIDSPRADTVQSAHNPGSPLRRRGGGYCEDQCRDQGQDQFAPRYHCDDRHSFAQLYICAPAL